ncbi:MAG TPA: hypothetical protein VFD70_21410 [Anaerolineae bacterium]|nr:hypothetical protein [Anaerolineae bacterium]
MRLTRPQVGRKPVIPQYAAGEKILPHVSDARAKGTRPAPTALPEPDEEPPDQWFKFHGFKPGPCSDAEADSYDPAPASSTIASLPISTAPAFCR